MISGHIRLADIDEGFARMKTGAPVRQLIDFALG
jgi:Zn-dependent alcohol dehydrogenase